MKKKQNCQERAAYCANLEHSCICQCFSGYIMVNGHCLLGNISQKNQWMLFKRCLSNVSINNIYLYYYYYSLANVHVGNACFSHLQCTGTDYARNCSNGVCHCQIGYLLIHGLAIKVFR